jgi:hypothetical protein
MNENCSGINNLIEKLIKEAEEKKIEEARIALKKFDTWNRFFNEVIKIDPINAKIHALVFTTKIAILCGILESLSQNNSLNKAKGKFIKSINKLNTDEKFLFSQMIEIGKDECNNEKIIEFYLENKLEDLESVFKNKAEWFYAFRSSLIHEGQWCGAAQFYGNSQPLFLGTEVKRKDKEKVIKKYVKIKPIEEISLEEIILRAIARFFNLTIKNDDIESKVKKFLANKGYHVKYFELFKNKFKL